MRQGRGHLAHRAQARDVNQLRLQLLHTPFGASPRAHIPHEAGNEAPPLRPDLARRELHRKDLAVLAPTQNLAADPDDPLLAGPSEAFQILVVLLTVRRGHEAGDISPDHLGRVIAEHPLGGWIEGLDDPAVVDRDQAVGRGLQDRTQQDLPSRQRRAA